MIEIVIPATLLVERQFRYPAAAIRSPHRRDPS